MLAGRGELLDAGWRTLQTQRMRVDTGGWEPLVPRRWRQGTRLAGSPGEELEQLQEELGQKAGWQDSGLQIRLSWETER